jgi:hypothetical protein
MRSIKERTNDESESDRAAFEQKVMILRNILRLDGVSSLEAI